MHALVIILLGLLEFTNKKKNKAAIHAQYLCDVLKSAFECLSKASFRFNALWCSVYTDWLGCWGCQWEGTFPRVFSPHQRHSFEFLFSAELPVFTKPVKAFFNL